MIDLVRRVEDNRIANGLTQTAAAKALGISQPHYSKLAGGVVPPGPGLVERMEAWVADSGPASSKLAVDQTLITGGREILELTRSIERQSRRLASLLAAAGVTAPKRPIRRVQSRRHSTAINLDEDG